MTTPCPHGPTSDTCPVCERDEEIRPIPETELLHWGRDEEFDNPTGLFEVEFGVDPMTSQSEHHRLSEEAAVSASSRAALRELSMGALDVTGADILIGRAMSVTSPLADAAQEVLEAAEEWNQTGHPTRLSAAVECWRSLLEG